MTDLELFIGSGVLMTVLGGWFFGLLVTSGMEDGLKKTIVGIIVSLVFGFGVGGLLTLESVTDHDVWNNGYCSCGYEWELIDIERTRHGSTIYYYGCDDCGKIIESHTNFGK